jgi:hypothetical protein
MKRIILTVPIAIALQGCTSSQPYPGIIDEIIPPNVASQKEWDGSKGEFPPGRSRVIDYKGHRLDYSGHAQHHYHMKEVHGHNYGH